MNIEESYVLCLTSAEDRSARLAYLLLPPPSLPRVSFVFDNM